MRILLTVCALMLVSFSSTLAGGEDQERRGVFFDVETSLEDGVKQFNEQVAKIVGGNHGQLPLTTDEVVAAIRGWIPKRHPAKPEILKIYQEIAETGKLPPGTSIDFTQDWTGYNGFHFDVWWVDISIGSVDRTTKPGVSFYTYRIRDQKIRSRTIDK